MAEWNHRLCEHCWLNGSALVPAPGIRDGYVRVPSQVLDVPPGTCCMCGQLTVLGIYFRQDERNLMCLGMHSD